MPYYYTDILFRGKTSRFIKADESESWISGRMLYLLKLTEQEGPNKIVFETKVTQFTHSVARLKQTFRLHTPMKIHFYMMVAVTGLAS